MNTQLNRDLETLLEYLKQTRAFEFTAYKRSTLGRRVQKRLQALNLEDHGDYIDYLEVHPDEFSLLFNTILINVTSFFRDAATWDWLKVELIPRIVAAKDKGEPIRVWSAGCASGEEPYSLAILFADALGVERFKEQVKIYATDVDEEALAQGRHASYTDHQIAGVPPSALASYFERSGGRHVFNKELRRNVIFGRHDLIQDAPISRVSLLVCRNTLMYFNAETQAKIIDRFHFALENGGFFFLGKAEMLLARSTVFAPVDLKGRVFEKLPKGTRRDRSSIERLVESEDNNEQPMSQQLRLETLAMEADPIAQLVVDLDRTVILANQRARSMFGLASSDVGRLLQDLEISYRPVELRSLIERACAERRQTGAKEIEWTTPGGETMYLELTVMPLVETTGVLVGAKVVFRDVTRFRRLQEELRGSHQELETAYEELQSTNEELETTNEELQSAVEELETTNEELQSTNEELETMNEELQSTNEELSTANDQLRQQGDELTHLNAFLDSILGNLQHAVVVLDKELRVQGWNRRAEDLWGLRGEEVRGQHFLNLDIGLPIDRLRQPIRAVLSGEHDGEGLTVEAINRRGKHIDVLVGFSPLAQDGGNPRGVILLMQAQEDRPTGVPERSSDL
jgi:two-component system, chemotaxis family, CheB/CheR fusion protein